MITGGLPHRGDDIGPTATAVTIGLIREGGEDSMTTAIIGVGRIGTAVATRLTEGGESVLLSANSQANASRLADELGPTAATQRVADAIELAEAVVFAVWFDALKGLLEQHRPRLAGKVVVDPSNPVAMDEQGQFSRTLPDGVSAGSVLAGLLTPDAHYVKAFGTLSAENLMAAANRGPERVALFYATDDGVAATTAERLISAAGFDPVKAGGMDQAIRIEMFGDLHEYGGLDGRLLTAGEARTLVSAPVA
jgi:predicted dinucleotide-binding enzyme